jgi:hypothetical protein
LRSCMLTSGAIGDTASGVRHRAKYARIGEQLVAQPGSDAARDGHFAVDGAHQSTPRPLPSSR